MKKFLFLLVAAFIITADMAYSQTYKIETYRWGHDYYYRSSGKFKKANFNIVMDLENNTLTVEKGKKPDVYTISSNHVVEWEKYNPGVDDKAYCLYRKDNGKAAEVLFRMINGKVKQICIKDEAMWTYNVKEE